MDNGVVASFLLGLDVDLVAQKYNLKTEQDRINAIRKNLRTDSIFKEFFVGDRNPDLELRDLDDEIERLERDVQAFQVAENYYDIEKQANQTKRKLQDLKNQAIALENSLENIKLSLQIRPDISTSQLQNIFDEASLKLPDLLIHELTELEDFHTRLIDARVKRLSSEKNRLERVLEEKNKEISLTGDELNRLLNYLGAYRALDELIQVSNHLNSLRTRAQKIVDYKNLLERYETETQEIKIKMANENRRAADYLKSNKDIIDASFEQFRSLAKRFYAEKPGGLTIQNNDGDNQIRFNIDARIQDDTSDGINEVKLFCFDMTVLSGKRNHHIDFIFHDSRLFSNMDPRQRAILFKLANEYTMHNKEQYIASLNEDQLINMKDQLSPDEFENILMKNIVLELTDKSAESKLLGIQVDLKY